MAKILLTGATGYIGQRLLPLLLQNNHFVYVCARDKARIPQEFANHNQVKLVEVDFLNEKGKKNLPLDIDAAYYLMHSMSSSDSNFSQAEVVVAQNFVKYIHHTQCQQIIYLTGIVNADHLSKHLQSRFDVEKILQSSSAALTALRAGIIVGSGSASFEIIRDLVEKLPIMVTPKWLNTKSQPIAIRDVLSILTQSLLNPKVYNDHFDIGMRETLTYKQMLLQFAQVRGLKRYILTLPVMTPKLSSYWLYFVTSTSYNLACHLVDSMKVEVVCHDLRILDILKIEPINYKTAIEKAFDKIKQNSVVSSWKDAFVSGVQSAPIKSHVKVPEYGCFTDERKLKVKDIEKVKHNIWMIGGDTGWYYGNWLWRIRGFADKLVGGVGLRRGRKDPEKLTEGDALDFWRVILADKPNNRLLLYAEMKLPGEGWLEFRINEKNELIQKATFRPKGIGGRLYWYSVLPFHGFIFNGMINGIAK